MYSIVNRVCCSVSTHRVLGELCVQVVDVSAQVDTHLLHLGCTHIVITYYNILCPVSLGLINQAQEFANLRMLEYV